MKRWRLQLVLLSLALLTGVLLLSPPVYWPIVGRIRGDAFYQDRPTSYWSKEAQNLQSLGGIGGGSEDFRWMHNHWMRSVSLSERLWDTLGIKRVRLESNDFALLNPDPRALPVLIELLNDPAPQVRKIAAQGLGNLGPKASSAIPALQRASDDDDPGVRQQAIQALRWIVPEK